MISKIMQCLNSTLTNFALKYLNSQQQKRYLWEWFYILFNRVDSDRLKRVGPDRSCAEWILKNGGAVRFKIQNDLIKDYNDLAPESSNLVQDDLVEVYADGASLHNYGFHHFKDCKHITKITFISCNLVGDEGLKRLQLYLKSSLKDLEIKSCPCITDRGILNLAEMRYLNKLVLHNLPSVSDKEKCETTLRKALQNTDCDFSL